MDPNVAQLLLRNWRERHRPASANGSEPSNMALRAIAAGTIKSQGELVLAMHLLRIDLGEPEMMRRVTLAVYEGQDAGFLSAEDASAALAAMTRELHSDSAALSALDAESLAIVQRSDFLRALEVSPLHDDLETVAQAKRDIETFLETRRNTEHDRDQAASWLRNYVHRIYMLRKASPGEPAGEGS